MIDLENCPFCNRHPHEPMHYITGRQVFERHSVLTVLLSFTCVHSLPEERPEEPADLWTLPGTFLVHAQTIEKRTVEEEEAKLLPGIKLSPEDMKRFSSLGKCLEES